MEEDAGPCLPFNVRTSIHGPLYILHAFRRWLPWLHLSKRSLRLDLVVPKCQGRRIRRQFCRANGPRKDLCFRLPFYRQEAVRARQKAVTANLNSRDLMYRLGPAPKSGTRPI